MVDPVSPSFPDVLLSRALTWFTCSHMHAPLLPYLHSTGFTAAQLSLLHGESRM